MVLPVGGERASTRAAIFVFMQRHQPIIVLTAVTFALGWCWIWLCRRHPLIAIAIYAADGSWSSKGRSAAVEPRRTGLLPSMGIRRVPRSCFVLGRTWQQLYGAGRLTTIASYIQRQPTASRSKAAFFLGDRNGQLPTMFF